MNQIIKKALGAFLIGASLLASPAALMASEPGNNTWPNMGSGNFNSDWEVLGTSTTLFPAILSASINSNSDVDYVLLDCATVGPRYILRVKLGDAVGGTGALPGDYDVYIYQTTGGSAIASGTLSGTSAENVDVSSFQRNTLVAKVVRFTGALGNYGLRIECGTP